MPQQTRPWPCMNCPLRTECKFVRNDASYQDRLINCSVLREPELFYSSEETIRINLDATEAYLKEAEKIRRQNMQKLNTIFSPSEEKESKIKLPWNWKYIPIVFKYTSAEFFELAFSDDTNEQDAKRYQKAIARAIRKFGEGNNVNYLVPFEPTAFKQIRFELNNH